MRFYTQQHRFYCGIDLHARTVYVCILNQNGELLFPTVQDFVSYSRLVKCSKESAGRRYGSLGAKIGNVHLKWAFSEASVLFLRQNPQA